MREESVTEGNHRIAWAESRMPVLLAMRAEYSATRPLGGYHIVGSTHLTPETAVLVRTMLVAGGRVTWCASNPATTDDAVVAALVADGATILARSGMSPQEYYASIDSAVAATLPGPTLAIDDGGDLIVALHRTFPDDIGHVLAGIDKTTTGVSRARALARAGRLSFPVVAVNDSIVKREWDNIAGTGQSTIDGIVRATGILLAGKTFVVGGFGFVGRGVAERARGMGARVVVTEVRPTAALVAAHENFEVMTMDRAVGMADVVCTATGMKHVVAARHFDLMRDGAILANAGHFDVEIDVDALAARSVARVRLRPHVEEFELLDGRRVHVIAEGRVVNLGAADGNPSEVMDLTFAAQAAMVVRLAADDRPLEAAVHPFPADVDEFVARRKLQTMGVETDHATDTQRHYAERMSLLDA